MTPNLQDDTKLVILLLPGMDGTGALFNAFIKQIPTEFDVKVASYPRDTYLTYAQTAQYVRDIIPASSPYVIIAESYSGPVACLLSETPTDNLRAVVFVSSFVSTPWGRKGRWISRIVPSVLLRLRPPAWMLRWFLMRATTPDELISEVREAIASISTEVLAKRLREALNADFSESLKKSAVRTICLVPDSDRLLGSQLYQSFMKARADIETVKIAGPHFLLQCAPENCWAALRKIGLFDTR